MVNSGYPLDAMLTRAPLKRFHANLFFFTAAVTGLLAIAQGGTFAAAERAVGVQVVDQRGMPVRDAVVEIARPAGTTAPVAFPWRNAMAQRNLAFVPGTLIVPQGSSVAFPNLDTVRHSIYSFSRAARFKFDLYGRDQTRTQRFDVSGTVALGCNIHDQMRQDIRVVNTPICCENRPERHSPHYRSRSGFLPGDRMASATSQSGQRTEPGACRAGIGPGDPHRGDDAMRIFRVFARLFVSLSFCGLAVPSSSLPCWASPCPSP